MVSYYSANYIFFGYLPGRFFGSPVNLPKGVARQGAKWGKYPNYVLSFQPETPKEFQNVEIPIKFITFTDDKIAPHKAAIVLQDRYSNAKKKHEHFSPNELDAKSIGHFGFLKKSLLIHCGQNLQIGFSHNKNKTCIDLHKIDL